MRGIRTALAVILTGLAALAGATLAPAQPAVQPGGDILRDFRLPFPPPREPHAGERKMAPPPPAAFEYIRREVAIPMRDGVTLHTVLIMPKGVTKAPILLDRTPYSADKETNLSFGPWPENILSPLQSELVRAGYILAVQDVRGKFRSGGDYVLTRPLRGPLNPTAVDHSTDAYDSIDWLIRSVPESDGKVATIGISYNGFTALMALIDPHPALKAAVPINPMVDVWKGDDWFHNGAFRQQMIAFVYGQTAARNSGKDWYRGRPDEYSAFLSAGSAEDVARSMRMERLPFWRRLAQHPAYDGYWQAQALDRILASRGLAVPTLIVGSLWDQEDIYGAPALFNAVKRSGKASLVLGPWYHGQANGVATNLGPMSFGTDTGRWFRSDILLPFLDQHLKGGPAADIGRVTAFETGPNRWLRHDDWPLACNSGCAAGLTPLFLTGGRKLAFAPGGGGANAFVSDPATPVPYRLQPIPSPWASNSTWRSWLADDQRFASTRPDVLTYVSEPLQQPLRLAGEPMVNLVATTTGTDADWVVKLIDVFPPHGPRADYQLGISMDVFRGRYRSDPARPEPLKPQQRLTYRFPLPHVSYTVQPGHRLMVQVQSSWFPLYDRNPQSFVPNIFYAAKSDYQVATHRVAYGANGTWIGLPVVKGP